MSCRGSGCASQQVYVSFSRAGQGVWEQKVSKLGNPQLLIRTFRFHLFHFTGWKFHSPIVLLSALCCSSEEKQMLASFQQQFFCKHAGPAWLRSVCWCSSQMMNSYCRYCARDVKADLICLLNFPGHLGNADMIQPGLIPLQPNFDFMDTFEPFQGKNRIYSQFI